MVNGLVWSNFVFCRTGSKYSASLTVYFCYVKHLFYELVPVNINKSSGGSTGCDLLVSIDVRSLDGFVTIIILFIIIINTNNNYHL